MNRVVQAEDSGVGMLAELSDDLLASILKRVPLGKAKVGMQAVSR